MLIYENRLSKMNFFSTNKCFSGILVSKMSVKMNLKFKPKNHAADPEIQFLTKSILRPYGRAAVMPTALELMINSSKIK